MFKFVLAPLLLLLLVEGLFQAGIWEPLAKPDSHAGTSIQLKRALADPAYARIDFVTLGSSRPEYGIDHEALAALGVKHGSVHADLSMPGSHWMTIQVLTRWLARHHPEIRGGVIGLSAQDFLFIGNGSYELGIVHPFHRLGDIPLMARHVPPDRTNPETWAAFSALFQYRDDVQDLAAHPRARQLSIAWWKSRSADTMLRENPHPTDSMCDYGLDSLAACDLADAGSDERAKGLQRQCVQLRNSAKNRIDIGALSRQVPPPEFIQRARDAVHQTLRSLHWTRQPVVILMPMPRVWQTQVGPIGLREHAVEVLQPLVADGTIQLIDATDALDLDGHTDCTAFFDFYHQNEIGRTRLMQSLLPQIESLLYGDTPSPATTMP